MATTENKKCAHPPCNCMSQPGDAYCSQICKDAGRAEVEIGCECGHEPCSLA